MNALARYPLLPQGLFPTCHQHNIATSRATMAEALDTRHPWRGLPDELTV